MNNKVKLILKLIVCLLLFMVVYGFFNYYVQRLTVGILTIYRDVFWLNVFYPSRVGFFSKILMHGFNLILPISVFGICITVMGFILSTLKPNLFRFFMGLLFLFFFNFFVMSFTFVLTTKGFWFEIIKIGMALPIAICVMRLKDFINIKI